MHRKLVTSLLVIVVGAFGFGYALVPLYSVFCDLTGFGGRTNTEAATLAEAPDLEREIRVQFVTIVNSYAPFEFSADVDSMTVHPGKMYFATFAAKNLSHSVKVAQAVPSITPTVAAEHFVKIECFCFNSQEFRPDEQRALPLQFIVDPDVPDYVDTITLQYTFFDTARIASNNQ